MARSVTKARHDAARTVDSTVTPGAGVGPAHERYNRPVVQALEQCVYHRRVWSCSRRKVLWQPVSQVSMWNTCSAAKKFSYRGDELVVVCLVRDGLPWIGPFIEHYFLLGARHIVFLDNGSSDATVSVAAGYDNVSVLRSTLPFNRYELLLRQYLIERFGKGRWSLCVDIDELFDYPYSDVIGLGSLLGYLKAKSYTAVTAQMLDMFPEEPLAGPNGRTREVLPGAAQSSTISPG